MGHHTGFPALASCQRGWQPGWGEGASGDLRLGAWGWDWFTGRDESEVTESCLELIFVCHAVQDGPWSRVDIYFKSNELTEYSVEDRDGKYSILLEEGIATFSYRKVFLGV